MRELELLSSLHGVGVILIDKDNPLESQIIISAKERYEVDWNNANRLAEVNSDFNKYIKRVIHDNKKIKNNEDELSGAWGIPEKQHQ